MMKGDVISKKMNEAIAQMSFSSDGSKLIDQDNSGKKMDSTVALVKNFIRSVNAIESAYCNRFIASESA